MHNVLNLLFRYSMFRLFLLHCSKSFSNVCVRPITLSPTYSNLNIYNDSFTTNGSAH